MANEIATAYFSLVPSAKGLTNNIQKELSGPLTRVASSSGASVGRSFSSSFSSRISSGLSAVTSKVATIGKVGLAALGGLGVAAGGWGLKLAADAETASASFELLLGNGQKAQAFMQSLQQFAAKTPFEFPELRDAASRLLAVGTNAKSVIPIMQTLGDATAGMGTGAEGIDRAVTALTQMQQKGKVTGDDMLQLAEAGVPAWDALATVLGTNVAGAQKKVSDGTVQASTLFQALETKAGPSLQRLTGLMDKQSVTLSGLLSTLKDTVGQNLATQLAPLAAGLKAALPDISAMAGDLAKLFGLNAAKLVGPLTTVVSTLAKIGAPVVASLADGVADLAGGLAKGLQAAGPGIASFADAFGHLGKFLAPVAALLGRVLGEGLRQLSPVLDTLISALQPLLPILGHALLGALRALAPIWPVWTKAIRQLAPLLAVLARRMGAQLVKAVQQLVPLMVKNAPSFMQLAEAVLQLLIAVTPLIGPLVKLIGVFTRLQGLEFAALAKFFQAWGAAARFWMSVDWGHIWGLITGGIAALGRGIATGGKAVIDWFKNLPGLIVSGLSTLVTQLIPKGAAMLGGFLAGLVRKLPELIGFMIALPIVLNQKLGAMAARLIPKALSFLGGFLIGLIRKLPGLAAWMAELPGKLAAKLVGLAAKLIPKGISLLSGFLTGMVRRIPDLIHWIAGVPRRLLLGLGNLELKLLGAGKDLIRGLWNGINSMGNWLADKVKGFAGGIVKGFTKALHIGSPSKLMAEKIGKPIAQGIGVGMAKHMPNVTPFVSQLVGGGLGAMPSPASRGYRPAFSPGMPDPSAANRGAAPFIGHAEFHDGVDLDLVKQKFGYERARGRM